MENIKITSEIVDSLEAVGDSLKSDRSPIVLFWYIGAYGLKKDCVNYYRNFINETIKKGECVLYDLSAWKALFDKKSGCNKVNSNVKIINEFKIKNLYCLSSSDFFESLKNNNTTTRFFEKILLETPFIYKKSLDHSTNHKNNTILIKDVFTDWFFFKKFNEKDTRLMYSALQYIELLFLIKQIIVRARDITTFQITLLCPNDEYKYYCDDSKTDNLKKDLHEYLGLEGLNEIKVNLRLCIFNFGNESNDRPYNSGKRVIKKLKPEDF